MSDCRRCTECEGREHHWLEDPHYSEDMDDDERLLEGDYGCKHCEQRGEECPVCGGSGGDYDVDDDGQPVPVYCGCCKGEGVVTLEEYRSLKA